MLREIVDVDCEIYFLDDLFKFEKKLNLNINLLIQEWKDKKKNYDIFLENRYKAMKHARMKLLYVIY